MSCCFTLVVFVWVANEILEKTEKYEKTNPLSSMLWQKLIHRRQMARSAAVTADKLT
jgi:hypothetical protein